MTRDLQNAVHECLRLILEEGWDIQRCLSRYPDLAGDLRPLLEAAQRFQAIPQPRPSPEALVDGRERVLQAVNSARTVSRKRRPLLGGVILPLALPLIWRARALQRGWAATLAGLGAALVLGTSALTAAAGGPGPLASEVAGLFGASSSSASSPCEGLEGLAEEECEAQLEAQGDQDDADGPCEDLEGAEEDACEAQFEDQDDADKPCEGLEGAEADACEAQQQDQNDADDPCEGLEGAEEDACEAQQQDQGGSADLEDGDDSEGSDSGSDDDHEEDDD